MTPRTTPGPIRLVGVLLATVAIAAAATDEAGGPRFTVASFQVEGDNPLDAGETMRLLAPFTGPGADLERLQAAADALQAALRRRGYAFHQVTLPPQTLDGGKVRLHVSAPALGEVRITGNHRFSERNIRASLPQLRPAIRTINTRRLARSLALANRHPAKHLRLNFRPGRNPGTVDAEITVTEQRPLRAFAWLNNSGTEATGRGRLGVGVQHSNLWDRDHAFTLTYTTSPGHPNQVSQTGLRYRVPWYRAGGLWDLLYVYSDVDSGTVAEGFEVSGRGTVAGLQYTQLLNRHRQYRHELQLGITDKLFDNTVDFLGTPLGVDVRSRPLTLGYRGRRDGRRQEWEFYLDYSVNLPGGEHNTGEAYRDTRAGADEDWRALHFGGRLRRRVSDWLVVARFDGQYAGAPLIPGEQFGLGGARSVRGLEEREVLGDRGYRAGLEIWTPRIRPVGLRLVGFLDGGRVKREASEPGEIATQAVASAGLGLRWGWRSRLSLNLDWGHVLNGVEDPAGQSTRTGDDRIHANLAVRF